MKRTKTYLLLTVMLLMSLTLWADDFTLKGKVIDEDNNALEPDVDAVVDAAHKHIS